MDFVEFIHRNGIPNWVMISKPYSNDEYDNDDRFKLK